jgi:dihydrofolate reductase
MRKVTFGAACSLDGFIARPDHAVDWLRWSKDVGEITNRFWKTIDTVVMGRKTYEVAARNSQPLTGGCVYVLYRIKHVNDHRGDSPQPAACSPALASTRRSSR